MNKNENKLPPSYRIKEYTVNGQTRYEAFFNDECIGDYDNYQVAFKCCEDHPMTMLGGMVIGVLLIIAIFVGSYYLVTSGIL